jgi:hypothetical protein
MKTVTCLFAPNKRGGEKKAFFLDVTVNDVYSNTDLVNKALENNSATYAYQKCGLVVLPIPSINELLNHPKSDSAD